MRNEISNRRATLYILIILVLWGIGGWIAPVEAGPLKDAASFTENKIIPAADKATAEMNEYVKKEGPVAAAAAKRFAEEKIMPNAKVAGAAIADKSKKIWQVLISE